MLNSGPTAGMDAANPSRVHGTCKSLDGADAGHGAQGARRSRVRASRRGEAVVILEAMKMELPHPRARRRSSSQCTAARASWCRRTRCLWSSRR